MTGPVVTSGAITLIAISDAEWRIGDSRIPAGDAGCVLGFAERVGERYEVIQLGPRRGTGRLEFGSLGEIAEHFAGLVDAMPVMDTTERSR
jgi:hypothetical protein